MEPKAPGKAPAEKAEAAWARAVAWARASDQVAAKIHPRPILTPRCQACLARPARGAPPASTAIDDRFPSKAGTGSGTAPTRYLVVGTRAPVDTITYPDHDRVCHRDRSLPDDIWTDRASRPAQSPY